MVDLSYATWRQSWKTTTNKPRSIDHILGRSKGNNVKRSLPQCPISMSRALSPVWLYFHYISVGLSPTTRIPAPPALLCPRAQNRTCVWPFVESFSLYASHIHIWHNLRDSFFKWSSLNFYRMHSWKLLAPFQTYLYILNVFSRSIFVLIFEREEGTREGERERDSFLYVPQSGTRPITQV